MKSDKTGLIQYGALPWRRNNHLEILLITSRETARWVIPKGWPMKDLAGHQSAAREALEEAGIEGEVSALAIGSYPYLKRLKDGEVRPLTVEVFPMQVSRELPEWPEHQVRQRRWFAVSAAADSVDEQELAELIRAFDP